MALNAQITPNLSSKAAVHVAVAIGDVADDAAAFVLTITLTETNFGLPYGVPQIQSTNPEAVPTLSARNSKASLWPLGTPGRAERASYPGTYPNVFAAPEDSQMHSA
jgi:hypothetical protein